ncbi:histidine phosphatase superfamily (branch 1) domain-containing protein [Ditylenchus destructor]|uniref:Histidine phosphatase superfamily (Branch 1) domain-containing protein n=1 Tax=Ditylenchus destructor TaxID=166010 RepID=A0AAD4MKT3_9BILA|nr:histidine phosphatase superfamily (branch 1) domain-containing protein [Ditylenchus destructor]
MPKNEEEESNASNSNPSVSQKPKLKYERLNKLVAVSTKAPWLCKHKIVTLVRNAERVDRVFPEWLSENINDAGMYQPDDLNLPVVLWARPDGYRCYMDDCPVTEIGACVSQLVGRGLRKSPLMPIQRFYCSPAFRSVQTALEMSKGLGGIVEICIEPALFDFLGWYKKMPSLLSTADFLRLEMNINPEYVEKKSRKELQSLVGKETIDGFYARISKAIREIVKREHKISHFVIITHAPGNEFITILVNVMEIIGVDAAIKSLKNCAPTAITENDLLHMGTYYPYSSTVTLANNGDDWSFVHDPFPSFSYLGTTNRVNSKFVERTLAKGAGIPVESQESKK